MSRVHRIPTAARSGILVVDANARRLARLTEVLSNADRSVIAAGTAKEAFGALASGFVPDVVVAAIEHANDVFGTMSAMPKFARTRFVAITANGFVDDDTETANRLARIVATFLEQD